MALLGRARLVLLAVRVPVPRVRPIVRPAGVGLRTLSRCSTSTSKASPCEERAEGAESDPISIRRASCLPSNIAGMYAYVADLGYCILLNASDPHQRRRWTLAHEYGHSLVDRYKPGPDGTILQKPIVLAPFIESGGHREGLESSSPMILSKAGCSTAQLLSGHVQTTDTRRLWPKIVTW